MKFLVTTDIDKVNEVRAEGYRIIMVDGTVPGYEVQERELHYDHHRQGGQPIQLDELPLNEIAGNDQEICLDLSRVCFVTTMVDADACVAAASVILAAEGYFPGHPGEWMERFRAIAWDCDHLYVPSELSHHLADFAAQAVAAMKIRSNALVDELELPRDRKAWTTEQKELFASRAFEMGVLDLVSAAYGKAPYPGENGEATDYWRQVEAHTKTLLEQNRVTPYRGCVVIDLTGLGGKYIDPRCPLRVVKSLEDAHFEANVEEALRESQEKEIDFGVRPLFRQPITLTQREVFVEGELKGYSYTLGVIPWHKKTPDIDYTVATFSALTDAEVAKGGDPTTNKWGGRKTVGGSGWNATSLLSPEEVIDIVLDSLK